MIDVLAMVFLNISLGIMNRTVTEKLACHKIFAKGVLKMYKNERLSVLDCYKRDKEWLFVINW